MLPLLGTARHRLDVATEGGSAQRSMTAHLHLSSCIRGRRQAGSSSKHAVEVVIEVTAVTDHQKRFAGSELRMSIEEGAWNLVNLVRRCEVQ